MSGHPIPVYRNEQTGQIHVRLQPNDEFDAVSKFYVDVGPPPTAPAAGPGPIDPTSRYAELTTTGTGDVFTLADGPVGAKIAISLQVESGGGADTAIITPANFVGAFSTVTLAGVGNSHELLMTSAGWVALGGTGVLA